MASKRNRNGRGDGATRSVNGTERAGRAVPVSGPVSELIRTGAQVIRQVGSVVGDRATTEATELTRKLRDEGGRLLERQKGVAAEGVGQVGAAIHQAADRLHMERAEGLSQYVESAAERVDKVSQYLGEQDLAAMAEDAQRLARRRPAWFVGGMLVTGLVLGRFLKAARQPAEADWRDDAADGNRSRRDRPRRHRRAD